MPDLLQDKLDPSLNISLRNFDYHWNLVDEMGGDCHVNDLCHLGYKYIGVPTHEGPRGGAAGFVIIVNINPWTRFQNILNLHGQTKWLPSCHSSASLYPPSRHNGLKMTQFLQESERFLSHDCTPTPS